MITVQLEEAAYDRRRQAVRDSNVESACCSEAASLEPASMDVVEGQLDQEELTGLLPGLVSELQQLLGDSDVDQMECVLKMLSKVGVSCHNQELTQKVDEIRQHLSQNPGAIAQIGVLVDDLDRLCGDIDRCCNKE